jgi:hypothetical protein
VGNLSSIAGAKFDEFLPLSGRVTRCGKHPEFESILDLRGVPGCPALLNAID